jgi:hypothetical protein
VIEKIPILFTGCSPLITCLFTFRGYPEGELVQRAVPLWLNKTFISKPAL